MRKLFAVLAAVLFALLCIPSLAEGADLTPLVGEWEWVFSVDSNFGFFTPGPENATTITIAADGLLTASDDSLTGTLEPTGTEGVWRLGEQHFQIDQFGQLCAWDSTDYGRYMSICHPPHWSYALNYPVVAGRSTAGTWQLYSMIYIIEPAASDDLPFYLPLDPSTLGEPFPAITLPAFASEQDVTAAMSAAIKSIDSPSAYPTIYRSSQYDTLVDLGRDALAVEYTLRGSRATVSFLFTRTDDPDIADSLFGHLARLSYNGPWRLDELSLDGLSLPASTIMKDVILEIDALGNTRLIGSDLATSLVMLEDEIYLRLDADDLDAPALPTIATAGDIAALEEDSGDYLRFSDSGYACLELEHLNGAVSLRFISDSEYRIRQLAGEWHIDRITIGLLGLKDVTASESLDIRLLIDKDAQATLISGDSEERFTLISGSDGNYQLTSNSALHHLVPVFEASGYDLACTALTFISADGSYQLTFRPAE